MMLGLVDDTVEVQLLGGNLLIHWDRETNHAFMTGPAAEVYHGEIEIPKR
jgi:diaminopimelate epimerase